MDFKTRLLRFYEVRCPSKCGDVDKLSIKYKNREKELFRQLTFKYGPEPKLSNADKTAAQKRNAKPTPAAPPTSNTPIDADEWMTCLLTPDDFELIRQIDNYSGQTLPQHILDKI